MIRCVAARMPLVYIRSDVSAAAETHSQNYTRMYSFDDATTQMRRIFQKDTLRPGYTALIELSYIACAWIAGIKYSPL